MLPTALENQFNDFYHAAYADGELPTGSRHSSAWRCPWRWAAIR